MEGEGKRERASTNVPIMAPAIEGVPPALLEFLSNQLTRMEASFNARFVTIEESIRSVSARLDDTQRSLRKLRRSVSQEVTGTQNTPSGVFPLISERSAETLSPRTASRNGNVKPPGLSISSPDLTVSPISSPPSTPSTGRSREPMPELEVTDDLLQRGVRPLQQHFRDALCRKRLQNMKDMAEERTFVAKELYDTELNYVHTLMTIQTVFMEPLMAAVDSPKPILTRAEIRELFGQIPVFYGINSEFLKVLTTLMNDWNPVTTKLGVVFLKNVAQFLRVYGAHVDSYSNQFNSIKQLIAKNAEFAKFVAEAEQKPECKMQDLPLMMLTVVQRITRYKILLTALQKATWPEHIDYDSLVQANIKVGETTMMVNEKKRESESLKRLLEIQSLLQGADENLLVAPHRRYLCEMNGHWMPRQKPMIVYLFNDSLLLSAISKKNGSHKMKQFCGLEGCRMTPDAHNVKRVRIDAPLANYLFDCDDGAKRAVLLEQFGLCKTRHREKMVATGTVNLRAMFNISHSSGNMSETLHAYRRRPGSVGDPLWGGTSTVSIGRSSSSRPATPDFSQLVKDGSKEGSAPTGSHAMRRSPSALDATSARASSAVYLNSSPSSPASLTLRKSSMSAAVPVASSAPGSPSGKSIKVPKREKEPKESSKEKESKESPKESPKDSPKSEKASRRPVQRNLTDISLMRG